MTKEKVIELGIKLGLAFNEDSNYKDALEKGIIVFDGCNGQRFTIETKSMSDDAIYTALGKYLVLKGMRLKALQISRVLSITDDYIVNG